MSSRLCIEPIGEEQQLLEQVSDEDRALVATFASNKRRREALAWRAALYRMLGSIVRTTYDKHGAPIIEGSSLHLGVSHSRTHIAIITSEKECAVDIESLDRDFSKAFVRYLTPSERTLSDDARYPAVAWCAKEALYKLHRRGVSDIASELTLLEADLARGLLRGTVCGSEPIDIHIEEVEGHIVASIG